MFYIKWLATLLALCLTVTACTVPDERKDGAEQPTQMETKEEGTIFQQDAQKLVETLEATHPVFFLDEVPEGYEKAKAEYLAESAKVTERDKFAFATQKCLASLNDGHTNVSGLVAVKTILDLPVVSDGEHIFVEDGSTGRPTDTKIVEMGGVFYVDMNGCVLDEALEETAAL